MKIVVCIKQVPGTSQVEIDPETGVLKRDGQQARLTHMICMHWRLRCV